MSTTNLIVVLLSVGSCLSLDEPSVFTTSGKIIGHYKTSHLGNHYKAYEGIPYALPPIGERRFKPPVPVQSWNELKATKMGNICLQYEHKQFPSGSFYGGSEDCLYLNIYVPNSRSTNSSLPVLFWIHGGAFQYGSAEENGEFFLMDNDLIFVSVTYRLGIFGFLSTEDDVVHGNMGLKDQSMALRWIHENIKYFGGDPSKITIMGLSAGGASVHYHYLSPMSAGLFHSGISFSGTAFVSWAQTENSREKALKLGALLNCPTNNTRLLVDCLKQKSAQDIVEKHASYMPWAFNPFTPFGPIVEKPSSEAFITRSPIDIISSGDAYHVPWITGVVSEEGLYPIAEYATNEMALRELNDNWEWIAPHLLDYNYTLKKDDHVYAAKKARRHYLGDKPINKENLIHLTHMVGDRLFIIDAEKAAREMAKANENSVYFYYYSYRATQSLSDDDSNSTEQLGVCHGDDVYLVLGNPFMSPKTDSDWTVHTELVKFWLSVIHKGVPDFGPKWTPVDPYKDAFDFLQMNGPGDFFMKKNDNLGQKSFWNTFGFNENLKSTQRFSNDSDTSKGIAIFAPRSLLLLTVVIQLISVIYWIQ